MKSKLLIILIGVLVVVHILAVIPAVVRPARFRTTDSLEYLDLANTFLSTGRYAGRAFPGMDLMRPPIYPFFMMFGLLVGQGDTGAVSILQVLVFFGTAGLLYSTCARLGFKRAGIGAAIFFLLNPNATFWSVVVMTETLAGFFLVFSLWSIVNYWKSKKVAWLIAAGAALAAGALTRPIIYPLAILLVAFFFILEWRNTRRFTESGKASILLLVAVLVLVLPWQLRNLVTHERFTISEVGGSTFQNWYVAQTLASAEGLTRDQASAQIASSENPVLYSLEVIRIYPGVFIKEQARGILRTLLGAEYGTWQAIYTGVVPTTTGLLSFLLGQGSTSKMLVSLRSETANPWFWAGMYALLYDLVLAGFILVGLLKVLRNYQGTKIFILGMLLIAIVLYLLLIPGVAGESRFRVPADPLLALAAGWAFLPLRSKSPSS